MSRIMPRRGFYLATRYTHPQINFEEVIFASGTKKSNRYARYFHPPSGRVSGTEWDWSGLMWTCVPMQRELDADYRFFETHTDLLAALPDDSALKRVVSKTDPSA